MSGELKELINKANEEALKRLNAAELYLIDVAPAKEVISVLNNEQKTILIAGPPSKWENLCKIVQGSSVAAVLFEGWANNGEEAVELLSSGQVHIEPCNEHNAVGPLTGVISPTLPVFVVENRTFGIKAFSRPAEMWEMWGNYNKLDNLISWRDLYAPAMRSVLRSLESKGGIYLNELFTQCLEMGDEMGNRQIALTQLLIGAISLSPASPEDIKQALAVLLVPSHGGGGPRAVIGISMAAAKAAMVAAENIEHSTVVTCMSRNGVDWSIQVSGLRKKWFICKSLAANTTRFHLNPNTQTPYSNADRGLDIGDSSIHETFGWSGLALSAASFRFLQMLGDISVEKAHSLVGDMRSITVGESTKYFIPRIGSALFSGVPLGIDIIKVISRNITPLIDTGIPNKETGHCVIARGTLHAPLDCFTAALQAFADLHNVSVDSLF